MNEFGEVAEARVHAILPPSTTSSAPGDDADLCKLIVASLHEEWTAGVSSAAVVAAEFVAGTEHDCIIYEPREQWEEQHRFDTHGRSQTDERSRTIVMEWTIDGACLSLFLSLSLSREVRSTLS